MASDSESELSDFDYSDIDEREKEEEEEEESDRELQRKFARGEIKPGLHRLVEKPVKEYKNNVEGLKQKVSQLNLSLPWIERFDLTCDPAPMAPELQTEIVEHGQRRERSMKSKDRNFLLENDPVHNDFTREMTFYRQAQAAVMEGYQRLSDLSLPTVRPENYFAQMAKSDEHMQKVRKRLLSKQVGQQISERVRKIREIKKYGKKVQIEVEQQKHKEKREMLDKIKKFRKGKTDSIDFLEDKKGPLRGGKGGMKGKPQKTMNRAQAKREHKNQKFGFGGKKKNSKRNTSSSSHSETSLPAMRRPGAQKKKGAKAKGNRNKRSKSKRSG